MRNVKAMAVMSAKRAKRAKTKASSDAAVSASFTQSIPPVFHFRTGHSRQA
jgi:hypothetical protein